MSSHTVESYDKDLSKLRSNIIDMAILVRDMIIIADKSLQEKNESFAEIAKATDEKINRFDSEIETRATNILALRQPMAIDLRESIAALKLAVILERMGDLAKHISNRVEKVSLSIDKESLGQIHKMSEINIYRIINAIKAYKNSDVHLAKEIFIKDKEVDHIYTELMLKLEQDIMKNPNNTKLIIQIIYAIKNLERIGDYISKVVTLVNYIITGERKILHE
jgi:phosphate transport system protein